MRRTEEEGEMHNRVGESSGNYNFIDKFLGWWDALAHTHALSYKWDLQVHSPTALYGLPTDNSSVVSLWLLDHLSSVSRCSSFPWTWIDHENPWQFNVSVFCMRLFGNFLQIGTMFPWIGAYNIVHAYSYISEGDGHSTKLKEGHSFRKHYMCHFRR